MTFSGHLAVAGLTTLVFKDPILLISLNIGLHFLVDAIPHAELNFHSKKPITQIISGFDSVATPFIALAIVSYSHLPVWVCASTMLASILPDLLYPLTQQYSSHVHRFHNYMHSWPHPFSEEVNWRETVTGKTPTFVKVGVQSFLVCISVTLLYLFR